MQDDVEETDGEYRDTYTEIATNCVRYFGYTIEQIDRLTLPEYELIAHAFALAEVDRANERHQRAWLTVSAGATKKDGKPVFKKFKDFFDYEAEIAKIAKKKPKTDKFIGLSKHMKEKAHNATGSKSDTDR